MNSYKHPISRYLNPQATHLSTLLFFGYIFWQAFKPNKKQNPAARYNEELVEIVYNSIMDWLNDLEESDPVFF
ncbi:MAG: hypothetical protein GWN31_04940, partial [Candidatus Thorarchaeota archaeon]|nr:hypothetical protein [Candidatus Thorarchaeota archaeon]